MKGTDRAVLVTLLAAGLLAAFYFMILAPKREEAAKLGTEVTELEALISQQEQVATFADQARQEFPKYYGRMVTLGKAVPEAGDSASLLVQLNSISNDAGTRFQGLQMAQASDSGAAAPPPTPAPTPPPAEGAAPPADGAAPPAGGAAPAPESTPVAASQPAAATESTAANLPIGASVGAAGLPTLPYDLDFEGSFFQIADFVSGLDELIKLQEDSGQVSVDGRLMTVDGFALQGGAPGSSPELAASFLVTTYVTPSAQGLTLGASPEGPATPGQPQITPAANVTP